MIKNNIKSLGLYFVVLIVHLTVFPVVLTVFEGTNHINTVEMFLGVLEIALLAFIGFVLKPQKNIFYDLISCMLVSAIGITLWAYSYKLSPTDLGFKDNNSGIWLIYYLYVGGTSCINIIFERFFGDDIFEKSGKLLSIFALIPSILMFIGIEARRNLQYLKFIKEVK